LLFKIISVKNLHQQKGSSMNLRAWMDKVDIDVFEAARAFGVSIYAIKKWLKGERTPRPATQAKIKKVTKGDVTGDDWTPKE
jgi:hypothetical protein